MHQQQSQQQTIRTSLGLQQTIKILQLNNIELNDFIDAELLDNPFLEYSQTNNSSNLSDKQHKPVVPKYLNNIHYDELSNLSVTLSLREYVTYQLNLHFDNHQERLVAYYMTDLLRDDGYFTDDIKQVSKLLDCSIEYITDILLKLQQLEPCGVFARNLAECLMLQLKDNKLYNPQYQILLDNLPKLAQKQFLPLANLVKVSLAELHSLVNNIKMLNPKPGHKFCNDVAVTKIPDVYINFDHQNSIVIQLNDHTSPIITIDKAYYTYTKNIVNCCKQRKFLTERYNAAVMLTNSLSLRKEAILKVTQTIAILQEDFFRKGLLHLKPLTLSKVAQILGMNESSISRITSNKYISCAYGVFDMKYFFSASISSNSSAEKISNTKVRSIINKIIELEDSKYPLSDDQISQQLLKFDVKVARRTIAKYRGQLKINPSHLRRQVELCM